MSKPRPRLDQDSVQDSSTVQSSISISTSVSQYIQYISNPVHKYPSVAVGGKASQCHLRLQLPRCSVNENVAHANEIWCEEFSGCEESSDREELYLPSFILLKMSEKPRNLQKPMRCCHWWARGGEKSRL